MLCLRLLNNNDPSTYLAEAVEGIADGEVVTCVHSVDPSSFRHIPNAPFAYWVSEQMRQLFLRLPAMEQEGRSVKVGDHPGDGFRFIRLAWEVPIPNRIEHWLPYQKGGSYSPFYADIHLVANWDHGRQSYRGFLGRPGRSSERPSNFEFFFRPGLTWPRRTTSGMSMRVLPAGAIFADKGPSLFVSKDSSVSLLAILGLCQSSAFQALVALQLAAADAAARSYEVGVIQRTVVPKEINPMLADLAKDAWATKRSTDGANITSHAFVNSPLARPNRSLAEGVTTWCSDLIRADAAVSKAQTKIDEIAYELYDFGEEDRTAIADMLGHNENIQLVEEAVSENAFGLTAILVEQLLGLPLGRWDIRYATGESQPPNLPDPFEPMPTCPPGMLQTAEGLPASPQEMPNDYPLRISWSGILVDDDNHPEDIVGRVREATEGIWKDRADSIEQEACDFLGVRAKPRENLDALRVYFRDPNKFFKDHLSRYSKSRRKAPIYWPLSTDSGSYTLWIYYHRLDKQTLYTCVEQFIDPKREQLGRDIEALRNRIGAEGSTDERQQLEDMVAFQQELKVLRDRLLKVAGKPYHPNLNDGVQITAAPLWECFRNRSWQTTLKKTWKELEQGKYDWAHLAMSIWPERVVPKCATDRSLAIAHGVEDLLWVPDETARREDQMRALESPDAELKRLKQAGHAEDDIDNAAKHYEEAKALGLDRSLWIEDPTGTFRRRLTPKQEIEAEINRRKGR